MRWAMNAKSVGRILVLSVTLAIPALARGHSAPIPPSDCNLELSLSIPSLSVSMASGSSSPAAVLRYDVAQSLVQLETSSDPVPLAANELDATVALPSAFPVSVDFGGELLASATNVRLGFAGSSTSLTAELTTGLVAADGVVASGAPIGSASPLSMVGVVRGAFPPPVADRNVLVRVSCVAVPIPDLDQFVRGSRVEKLRATATGRQVVAKGVWKASTSQTLPSAGVPVLFQLRSGPVVLSESGEAVRLQAAGRRRWAGQAVDGTSVRIAQVGGQRKALFKITVAGPPIGIPPAGAAAADVVIQVGAAVGRGDGRLRVRSR